MKVERSIDIAADPDRVYGVVMDPRRLGDWVTIQEQLIEAPERELARGDRLTQRLKVAGQRFEVRWEVTIAEPPRRVEWRGEGPLGTSARVSYVLAESDGGTGFDYVNEYELPGGIAGKIAGRAVAGAAGREAERTLRRLKAIAEEA